ncbi:hypothetical protein IMCC3317_14040 [Kordia antarctica]|uniref:Uncharacterized protein n=1 Tax=Kordia antarctica TaxID=1218801 RepID=A0A7L4ZHU4_9FLAO|nr:hypothetical protein [Kordia antarctica]QHI36051.1 hypothetical protein IMCC3317_14040 [Kordia antarctica]
MTKEEKEFKIAQIIRSCLSETDKEKIIKVYEKFEMDSELERENLLQGKQETLIPIISVSFGWKVQLALCKNS